ncbi:glutathione S-transferase family protein [Pseudomonas borbori]
MSVTLYGAPLSPFVRKVRLVLAEKGIAYQLEVVLPFGQQPDWYRELNPLGRIPALKDGDLCLADSSVICQYLDDQYPDQASLLGHSAEQRAQVRWLEKYADYELAPLSTFTVFRNRLLKPSMGQECDEQAVQQALTEKLPPHFDYLERTLGNADYFVGTSMTLADLAFACQMVNMEHGGETLDAQRWPNLAALYQRIKARPTMQDILPREQKTVAKISVPR